MRGFLRIGSALTAMLLSAAPAALPPEKHRGRSPHDKPVHDRRTSKYMPHQSEREMARRRRQMLVAYGRCPVTRFYGSLSGGE